jgi:hypothetical protein
MHPLRSSVAAAQTRRRQTKAVRELPQPVLGQETKGTEMNANGRLTEVHSILILGVPLGLMLGAWLQAVCL